MDGTAASSILFVDTGLATENIPTFTHAGRILVGVPGARTPEVLLEGLGLPDGVAVSKKSRRIFWTSMGTRGVKNGSLLSCDLSGRDVKTLISSDSILHTPKQLVVDDGSSKIYLCDREGLKVIRCNLDGSGLEVLIATGDSEDKTHVADQTRWCVGIALSHRTGKVYWTQKGTSKGGEGRILRANIDLPPGQNAQTRTDIECVLQNLSEPIDLSIDEERGQLYWTDRGELPLGNSINRVSIDSLRPIQQGDQTVSLPGKNYELLARHFHEVIGILVDPSNKYIYATDFSGRIYRLDLDGRNRVTLFEDQGACAGLAFL